MTTSSVTSPKPKMDLEHDLEVEKKLAPHGGKNKNEQTVKVKVASSNTA